MGCGSGVLSYFASKYSKSVLAIDNDDKSIQCAKKLLKKIILIMLIL
ncbi:50S ribosomal protein L11 methyltransferase [Methanobrevibacter arboriphilus]|nr:50S ribosomal protein L11 methyltransferase [Methanobrevibacter arboriphilus]